MEAISTRGRGNEERFFRQLEGERVERLHREASRRDEVRRLAGALHLDDEARAERLLNLGITAELAAAFEALPLVEVAWADGSVDEEERWRVLAGATRLGVELGTPAHAQLEAWLARRPAEALHTAWHGYALARGSPPAVLEAAEVVASAAGGVLGFARVSRAEGRALAAIRRSLAGVAPWAG